MLFFVHTFFFFFSPVLEFCLFHCISKLEKLHENSIIKCAGALKNSGEPETGFHILFSNAFFFLYLIG